MTHPAPSLSLVDSDPAELAVDALVIGLHSQPDEDGALLPAAGAESIAAAFDGRLTATLALLGATGAPGEVTKLATLGTVAAPLIVAVGLGDEPPGSAPAPETLRRGTGAAVRALAGSESVALALPVPDDADAPAVLRGILEGALLGSYRFAGYKTKPQPGRREPVKALQVVVPDAADAAAGSEVARGEAVARAVRLTRDWVNTPRTSCARRRSPTPWWPPPRAPAWRSRCSTSSSSRPVATAASWRSARAPRPRRGW
ncbi:hypothetical protein Asp14428_26700 [Actinoplanes sp. NBRC 14428]|nr:hypothetical protein Asp14428_26700 [Actinoplanes sp. NBRC 14428]